MTEFVASKELHFIGHRSKRVALSEYRLRSNWISLHNNIKSSIQTSRDVVSASASALDTTLCCTCSLCLKSNDSSSFKAFVQKFDVSSEHDG